MNIFSQTTSPLWVVMALSVTVLVAAWTDWRSWRIPNALVAASMAAALMYSAFGREGMGVAECLLGGLVGFAVFIPLYALKGMAAGDVKLMSAIGMHVGPLMVIDIALMTCLIGGLWAMVLMDLKRGGGPITWLSVFVRSALASIRKPESARVDRPVEATDRRLQMIPYGVVIALGTLSVIAPPQLLGR